eukprot:3498309-Amphidinium_carterae.1
MDPYASVDLSALAQPSDAFRQVGVADDIRDAFLDAFGGRQATFIDIATMTAEEFDKVLGWTALMTVPPEE